MMTAIMIIPNEQEIVRERKKVKKGALEYLLHPPPHPIRTAPGKLRQLLKAALRMKAVFLLDSLAYIKIDLITNTVLWGILYTHDHTSL